MTRPVGVSAGTAGLVLAWACGTMIAHLTGATPVVILLAAGLVLFAAAAVVGSITVRGTSIDAVRLPAVVTRGDPFGVSVAVTSARPVWIELRRDGRVVAAGWSEDGQFVGDATMERRGVVDQLDVSVRSAGGIGLVWWRRSFTVEIGGLLIAAKQQHGDVPIERSSAPGTDDAIGRAGAVAGETDGVRPWREGDSERFVHWASTVRAGELVVHDRRGPASSKWVVRARSGLPDPDAEAGAARHALEQGLRAGAMVGAAVDGGEVVAIRDPSAAAEWSALAELGTAAGLGRRSRLPRRGAPEPESIAPISARWWAAAATFVSLAMVITALDLGPIAMLLTAAGTLTGAAVSARAIVSGNPPSVLMRVLAGVAAVVVLALVATASGRLDSLVSFLLGPLPQLLVVLVVLHGFEAHDRRTIRVGLGISAIVLMYSLGFRVDDRLVWWLLTWAVCFGVALSKLAVPRSAAPKTSAASGVDRLRTHGPGGWHRVVSPIATRVTLVGAGLAVTVAVLAVVPVPAGAANLTFPTLIKGASDLPRPGAIVGPGGVVDSGSGNGGSVRAPAGQAGGYTGFAEQLDTSVRGELGDEIVMRVRAPQADFWRGQTFAEFDGRQWYADSDQGRLREGPTVDVPSSLGEIGLSDDVAVDPFVQTYYLEVDMSNLVFHAARPVQVILDADVWTRPDGALRASTTLQAGSIYTVISARVAVDAPLLRRQGLVGERLTPSGRQAFARYLELPASTTPETVELADRLAAGQTSTYDVVRAYETWMREHIEYDLNAPLPDPGEDAVNDFLFDTQLGFCEQIASALTVMMRSQGVPARLVTGYLPGTRDRIAGVFEVKSSDAHAWVEVWFPETGWQAFDPTASVPLSADARVDSVGKDLAVGATRFVDDHTVGIAATIAAALMVAGLVLAARELRYRRRRGRWGVLQDRFRSAASRRGASLTAPNPQLAAAWSTVDDAELALLVAGRLDRAAFDPTFVDDSGLFDETSKLVGLLPRSPG